MPLVLELQAHGFDFAFIFLFFACSPVFYILIYRVFNLYRQHCRYKTSQIVLYRFEKGMNFYYAFLRIWIQATKTLRARHARSSCPHVPSLQSSNWSGSILEGWFSRIQRSHISNPVPKYLHLVINTIGSMTLAVMGSIPQVRHPVFEPTKSLRVHSQKRMMH